MGSSSRRARRVLCSGRSIRDRRISARGSGADEPLSLLPGIGADWTQSSTQAPDPRSHARRRSHRVRSTPLRAQSRPCDRDAPPNSGGGQKALDLQGAERWRVRLEGGGARSTPAIGLDGTVYISAESGRLHALDPETGEIRWRFQTGGALWASPIVDSAGHLFIGSQDRNVYSLDPDGSLRWQRRLGGQIDSTGTIGPDGTFYCGCDDGNLYALR